MADPTWNDARDYVLRLLHERRRRLEGCQTPEIAWVQMAIDRLSLEEWRDNGHGNETIAKLDALVARVEAIGKRVERVEPNTVPQAETTRCLRLLLAELLNHDEKRYGHWTSSMGNRVRRAIEGAAPGPEGDWSR